MRSTGRLATAAVAAAAMVATIAVLADPALDRARGGETHASARPVAQVKDARLKFEINATDGDGGVQLFVDADAWRRISLFDPAGRRIFTSVTEGRMAQQGGTELFLESAEPPFTRLPIPKLLRRFPAGVYRLRGEALDGRRYVGSARLTHDLPAGPKLLSPLERHGAQDPERTVVRWRRVAPTNGSPIVGYQVIVVLPETGLRALPTVTLDVVMPPTATSMRVPAGFLRPGTEYEWEVLAIERSGNQTLSSATFTTSG